MTKEFCLLICCLFCLVSCEVDYTPDTNENDQVYVVEGHVESGIESIPTYVLLTKSLPFFSVINEDIIADAYVREAEVIVSYQDKSIELTEICTDDLTPELLELIEERFGEISSFGTFCIYLDILAEIEAIEGETYDLDITTKDGDELTATTTIPNHIPLLGLTSSIPAGNVPDTLLELETEIRDSANLVSYYRMLVAVNDRPYIGDINSVFDDVLIDGKLLDFPIQRPTYDDEDFEIIEQGLFRKGDTVHVKWHNIDRPHYDFWNSLEFDSNNGGPFANYTRAATNIQGGIGIWGGYSQTQYSYIFPE